eukprot:9474150-Pyramimonas_sp.AAC.1
MEALMLYLVASLMNRLAMYIGDVKNAFCQSEPLKRARGRVFVEPCDGVPVPPGLLIELIAPVYGLDDAPLAFHRAAANFIKSRGFERTELEPCWFVGRARGELQAQVLVEVDDWAI